MLRVAAGDGYLTAEELDERLEVALCAKTVAELAALTADLPGAAEEPQAKDLLRIDQQGGSVSRTGRWVVPQRMELRLRYSHAELDFTGAVVTRPALGIDLAMQGGTLTLVTGPGIVVDTDDLILHYGKLRTVPDAGEVPVTLRVTLSGRLDFGKILERHPRRSLRRRLRRPPLR